MTLLALLWAILAGQQEDLATPGEDLATPQEDLAIPRGDLVTPREDLATPQEDLLKYLRLAVIVIDGQETPQAAASRSQSSNNVESMRTLTCQMSPLTPPM